MEGIKPSGIVSPLSDSKMRKILMHAASRLLHLDYFELKIWPVYLHADIDVRACWHQAVRILSESKVNVGGADDLQSL